MVITGDFVVTGSRAEKKRLKLMRVDGGVVDEERNVLRSFLTAVHNDVKDNDTIFLVQKIRSSGEVVCDRYGLSMSYSRGSRPVSVQIRLSSAQRPFMLVMMDR